jgi:hypothetical protein
MECVIVDGASLVSGSTAVLEPGIGFLRAYIKQWWSMGMSLLRRETLSGDASGSAVDE